MAKLTLADATTTGYKVTTTINANNSFIEAAMENTLSRDGTGPNAMGADLDMNSNFITNLSTPTLSSHAATKGYVDGIVTTLVTLNETGVSAFALTLLDDADAAEARTTLGLGTAATSDTGDFAAASHTHATTDITSGTFADARIAQTNVTQHEAALSINSSQTTIEVSSETTGTLTSASFYKIVNVSLALLPFRLRLLKLGFLSTLTDQPLQSTDKPLEQCTLQTLTQHLVQPEQRILFLRILMALTGN